MTRQEAIEELTALQAREMVNQVMTGNQRTRTLDALTRAIAELLVMDVIQSATEVSK